jgi:hypothetical protein
MMHIQMLIYPEAVFHDSCYLLLLRFRTLNSSLILCWLMGRLSDWISIHTSLNFSFRILVSIMVNASSKA